MEEVDFEVLKPRKKIKPNGFILFTREWMRIHNFGSRLRNATLYTGRLWEKADPDTKLYYNRKAKEMKNPDGVEKSIMCCNGVLLSKILQEEKENEILMERMKHHIELEIKEADDNGKLLTKSFIVLNVNIFTRTLHGGFYIPAEIAAVEFTLDKEIKRTYHCLLNPRISLFGEQHNAQVHSEETHHLPYPPNAIGETNIALIYNKLVEFAKEKGTENVRPLYTRECEIETVKSALSLIKNDNGTSDVVFMIYSFEYLMKTLKYSSLIDEPAINAVISRLFDRADYGKSRLTCKFHQDIGVIETCSSSIVYTWCTVLYKYIFDDEEYNFNATELSTFVNSPTFDRRGVLRDVRCASAHRRGRGRGYHSSGWYPNGNVRIKSQKSLQELKKMFSHLPKVESIPPPPKTNDMDCICSRGCGSVNCILRGRKQVNYINDSEAINAQCYNIRNNLLENANKKRVNYGQSLRGRRSGRWSHLGNDNACKKYLFENYPTVERDISAHSENNSEMDIKYYNQCLRGRGPTRCIGYSSDFRCFFNSLFMNLFGECDCEQSELNANNTVECRLYSRGHASRRGRGRGRGTHRKCYNNTSKYTYFPSEIRIANSTLIMKW
ncbi:protein maelstrom 1-like [Teleopsis dalmanni]|uniref:protein maelstrom 1-like n=1 Tax=Teleopsis dalmanni TaxID=139649 RepID=UPI0018CFC76A|nr:protein maelstrom 1-like [Teleopsis dalmanni]XP_037937886.1 protein maelstrom 1-like [Teleopsis dalmanni]